MQSKQIAIRSRQTGLKQPDAVHWNMGGHFDWIVSNQEVGSKQRCGNFPVYPNLLWNLMPVRTNQVWVADIAYIQLADEFVYLAVGLDVYSRLVLGCSLERTLEAKLAVGALQIALDKRGAKTGLMHHSDRGVQYACGDYAKLFGDHSIRISLSRKRLRSALG